MDIEKPLEIVRDGHLGGYVRGGDPGTWCPNLWNWAVDAFDVQSVLDVGCGEAHSTRFFHQLGCEALGVEKLSHVGIHVSRSRSLNHTPVMSARGNLATESHK